YRVNYDKENWKLITRYLKSENYINIHVLNRAQIIDDAFHLMLAQQIEPLIFWDIVTYLEQETDYVAWYPMFKALEYMSSIFTLDNIDKNIFVKLQNILQSILNKIRHTELYYLAVEKHTKCLRQEAAKWSCLLGNNECLKEARNKLMLNFEHPKEYKILPWWKEWTYCYGLISIMDHYFDWTNMLFTWVKNSDHRISKFLTCIQNNDIIKAHLKDLRNMIMNSNSENHILRLALINDFLTMIAKHVKKDDIRNYMLNNYKEIIPGQMNTVATLTVIINHLYDDLHLTMLENFVLHDMNKEKIDLKRKKVHFAHSSKVWSDIHMEYEANTLKIQEKIKIRRIQIKKQHEFVQAFLQL
ncbi:aminopeptidase N-like, partial [Cataglyphis hispanica]|uniref:aminopeptidase N-like n=1 Tax=Cataglyphis hispanica TaxID=1086592 RepID=UPI00217FC18A